MGPERRGRRQCRDQVGHEQVLGKRVSTSCATTRSMPTRSSATWIPRRRDQQHAAATPIQQLRVHARRAGAPRPQEAVLLRLAGVAAEQPRQSDTVFGPVPDPTWLTDPASPNYVPPEARDPNAVKLLTLWPAPNVPGTNRYRTTITERARHPPGVRACGLQRQRELVVDGPVFARPGRLARRVHHRPDLAPGHRYQVGHLAVVEARRAAGRLLHELSYQLSSHRQSRERPRAHAGMTSGF